MFDAYLREDGELLQGAIDGSGAIVSFESGVERPLSSLIVNITPTQSGSGDPSPSNVRPISGWTGANVYVSPTADAEDGTVYPISWSDTVGTVYGGTLDVINGALTKTWGRIGADHSTHTWNKLSSATGNVFYYTPSGTVAKKAGLHNVMANKYAGYEGSGTQPDKTIRGSTSTGAIYIRDDDYETAADFRAAQGDLVICIELATIQTFNLTPTEVNTLLGVNNVWATAGDVSLHLDSIYGKIKFKLLEV